MPAVTHVALTAGLVLLAMIWGGPLLDAWRDPFAAGMVAHMGVVALAATSLIAIGLPERLRPGASMSAALPVIASLVELAAVWGWHAPSMRIVAETSALGTVAEQASFLGAGLLLWSTSFCRTRSAYACADGRGRVAVDLDAHDTVGSVTVVKLPPALWRRRSDLLWPRTWRGAGPATGRRHHVAVGAMVYLAGLFLMGRVLSSPSRAMASTPVGQD